MQIARDLPTLRGMTAALRAGGRRLAVVPTMGALHAGHLALVEAARQEAAAVIVSIFVNPLQVGPREDLARYPRDEAGDLEKLRGAGCDLAWLPGAEDMYPPGNATTIDVTGPAKGWEGEARPGHFRGVATVCCKLFCQTGADVALFGEKDWQQVQVVRRMARDLDLPVEILARPTVREADGLPLSSRNRYLGAEERARAARFPAALRDTAAALAAGAPVAKTLAQAAERLREAGFGVDYMALVEPETLHPMAALGAGPGRLIAAARIGGVRLLDNLAVCPG
jgi:pantoate--beta-alanine ligase